MINLLPPQAKKELIQEEYFKLLLIFVILILVFMICFAMLLGIIRIYLHSEIVAGESRLFWLSEQFSEDDPVLNKVKELNETHSDVSRFFKKRQLLSPAIDRLASHLPLSASLTSFSYTPATIIKKKDEVQKLNAKIAVTGQALTRNILLSFREDLISDPLFGKVFFPPSNWVEPEDITFSFQAEIIP